MIATDKVTEIFCVLDEFCKNLDAELTKNLHIAPIDEGYKRMRNRKGQMSKSEIMTILLCYHFGSFRNFKHYYLFFIKEHLAATSQRPCPTRVSWNSCPACSST